MANRGNSTGCNKKYDWIKGYETVTLCLTRFITSASCLLIRFCPLLGSFCNVYVFCLFIEAENSPANLSISTRHLVSFTKSECHIRTPTFGLHAQVWVQEFENSSCGLTRNQVWWLSPVRRTDPQPKVAFTTHSIPHIPSFYSPTPPPPTHTHNKEDKIVNVFP